MYDIQGKILRHRRYYIVGYYSIELAPSGAARKRSLKIGRAHASSGALPLGIKPIVVLHQDMGAVGWAQMQTAGAMVCTHTMSLEQVRLEDLVVVGPRMSR